MPEFQCEGFILKKNNFSEADKILTIFTDVKGKISVLAKGSRGSKSKLNSKIELLNYSIFYLSKGKSLDTLTGCDVISSFLNIKNSIEKTALAFYFCNLVDNFLPDHQKNIRIFNLMKKTLFYLNENEINDLLIDFFDFKLIYISGYKPQVKKCVFCHKELIENKQSYFSARLGGMLHQDCQNKDIYSKKVTNNLIKFFRFLEEVKLEDLINLKIDKKTLDESEKILSYYIMYILGKDLKSRKIYKKMLA